MCKGMLSKHCHISHGLVRMCMYIGFYYSLKKSFNALVFIFVGPEFSVCKDFYLSFFIMVIHYHDMSSFHIALMKDR